MKTLISLILIAILVISLVALVLAGCETKTPSEIADNYQDLAAAGEFQSDSGSIGVGEMIHRMRTRKGDLDEMC